LRIKNEGDNNVNKFYFTVPKCCEDKLMLLEVFAQGVATELEYKIIDDLEFKR
jgi:hypothetical protein